MNIFKKIFFNNNSAKPTLSDNFFSIIIDTCNHESWIKKCLNSCVNQNFKNFEVILMDANSDDNTFKIAKKYASKYPNLKVFQNIKRVPQIANILSLTELARPNAICVSVDGDDWLPHNNVLKELDKVYSSTDIWMTYGTYKEYTGFFSYRSVSHIYKRYPDEVISSNTFRTYQWLASHLRTYRRELFLKIDIEDFKLDNGEWLDTAGDLAFMIPMLEMSGFRSRYVKNVMYVYNVANMQRDGSINEKRQIELADYVRLKNKYSLIYSL
jgi:glycosyltransferase involved in cell wall biosynthesis